jgi:hypothetical protein
MRITIDLASVQDTSRVLAAAAEEYDRTATSLQAGDGLSGVTGPQRHWLFATVEEVAARIHTVAAQHRATAADLMRRCESAADNVSPAYAGIAVAGAPIALDRNNDGVVDTFAMDSDGDGFFESFVLDTEQDGIYDTVLISDLHGTLQAAYVGARPQPTVAAGGFGTGFSSFGTPAGDSPFGGSGGIFTGTGSSSFGTPAGDSPFGGSGGIFTGQMGYISSPALSGMVSGAVGGAFGRTNIFDTGAMRTPFLDSGSRDYGRPQTWQEWANDTRLDSDGDSIPNYWDKQIRNQDG